MKSQILPREKRNEISYMYIYEKRNEIFLSMMLMLVHYIALSIPAHIIPISIALVESTSKSDKVTPN